MALQDEIDRARGEMKTDAYSMSIGEWASLYRDGELQVHPEFQRFFRWTPTQKTRFIESLLLGIPVPPIFIAQSPEGVWDVVDGLQRLSTVFEFLGILKDENQHVLPPLQLESTRYLPSLEGRVFESDNSDVSFTAPQRLFIKRAKLDVSIILRESDRRAKYELFQRLNTGGSPLSDQEVRNCVLVMENRDFYFWLRSLASVPDFVNSTALTDKALLEQYDMELAVRFLIFRTADPEDLRKMGDVGDYLTDQVVARAHMTGAERQDEEEVFRRTFAVINASLASDGFRRFDADRKKHLGGFVVSGFEAVAAGLGYHRGVTSLDPQEISARVQGLWANETFTRYSGAGVRASLRIPKLVPLGREIFST